MKGGDMDLVEILKKEGFKTVQGYGATLKAIKDVADSNTTPLCSGYGIFPDGKKCEGCEDCKG